MSDEVKKAMDVIKQAMVDDCPSELGSYAHGWHCNIAMACYDAIRDDFNKHGNINSHGQAHLIANDAASRIMKLCFDVETTNEN